MAPGLRHSRGDGVHPTPASPIGKQNIIRAILCENSNVPLASRLDVMAPVDGERQYRFDRRQMQRDPPRQVRRWVTTVPASGIGSIAKPGRSACPAGSCPRAAERQTPARIHAGKPLRQAGTSRIMTPPSSTVLVTRKCVRPGTSYFAASAPETARSALTRSSREPVRVTCRRPSTDGQPGVSDRIMMRRAGGGNFS